MKSKLVAKALIVGTIVCPGVIFATETVPASGINTLVIEHTEGTIKITGGTEDKISFDIEKVSTGDKCETTYKRSDDRYKIITKESWGSISHCTINLTVRLPKNMAVEAKVGFGNFDLENFAGKVQLNLGTGNLTGDVGSNDISFDIGVGSADLRWSALPKKLNLSGKVGMGQVGVRMAQKPSVDATVKTGIGRFTSTLKQDDSSSYKMKVETGVGNVTLE